MTMVNKTTFKQIKARYMKTAMMELIEWCDEKILEVESFHKVESLQPPDKRDINKMARFHHTVDCLKVFRDEAKQLLEKEKEQIVNAHEAGFGIVTGNFTGEKYYSKTYKPLNNDQ